MCIQNLSMSSQRDARPPPRDGFPRPDAGGGARARERSVGAVRSGRHVRGHRTSIRPERITRVDPSPRGCREGSGCYFFRRRFFRRVRRRVRRRAERTEKTKRLRVLRARAVRAGGLGVLELELQRASPSARVTRGTLLLLHRRAPQPQPPPRRDAPRVRARPPRRGFAEARLRAPHHAGAGEVQIHHRLQRERDVRLEGLERPVRDAAAQKRGAHA